MKGQKPKMSRENFDQQLRALEDRVLILGGLVESALIEAVELLKRRDFEGSHRLISADQRINERRFELESDAMTLIATQQPVAGDMRILAAVLEIVTELERIGDYAKGIARINLMMGEDPLIKPLVDIPAMAEKARDMLHRALQAFSKRDIDLARAIAAEDNILDDLYNQVYRELLTLILSNPRNIDQATYLTWAAHNLERTGDRVLNICERVIFMVTGDMIELNREG
jgi:phosphate transport system protein